MCWRVISPFYHVSGQLSGSTTLADLSWLLLQPSSFQWTPSCHKLRCLHVRRPCLRYAFIRLGVSAPHMNYRSQQKMPSSTSSTRTIDEPSHRGTLGQGPLNSTFCLPEMPLILVPPVRRMSECCKPLQGQTGVKICHLSTYTYSMPD
jgi:hypothetical protein